MSEGTDKPSAHPPDGLAVRVDVDAAPLRVDAAPLRAPVRTEPPLGVDVVTLGVGTHGLAALGVGTAPIDGAPVARSGCGTCGQPTGCGTKPAAAPAADAPLLSTGDLARSCDTTVRTVRFYEEAGLIEPDARSEGGHRMFRPDQLAKLQLIMDLREAGLSLQDIKALFELKSGCGSAREASTEMAEVLEAQIACMTKKIAVLRRLREELASMLATIRECEQCDHHEFHTKCSGCDVMNRPELPRAMRLLWSSKG